MMLTLDTLISTGEKKISVKQAAMMMGKSEQFVRIGLQRDRFPFGTAVKFNSKWSYYIAPKSFYYYMGYDIPETSIQ